MLIEDMPMDLYRKAEGVSASDLKNFQRSPAYAKIGGSHSTTPALEFGTAVHTAVLEPDQLYTRYAVDPCDKDGGYRKGWRNTTEYKELRAERIAQPGVVGLLTLDEFAGLESIARNVARNEIGSKLHDLPGSRESSLFVHDYEFDTMRKCRPDWLIPSARMIVDVKTAQDWRAPAFSRACLRYGYHMSAAYYLDTFELYEQMDIEHYVFLVVASDAPYEVATYTLDRDSIEQGRMEYRMALRDWVRCGKSGEWPGGSSKIEEIRIPDFAINYHMEEDQWQ